MIERTERGDVTVVALHHGKANALDLELLRALSAELAELARTGRPVVLTGNGTMFSAGVDLVRLVEGGPAYVASFLPALDDALRLLVAHPRPVVAAVDGHAIAGGCVLACGCDHRLMLAGKGRIGVPELRVGVPFPSIALEIMRFVVPRHRFQDVLYRGETVRSDAARELGLIDEVVTEDVVEHACEVAARLGSIPAATFALSKRQVRQPLFAALERGAELDEEARALWRSKPILDAVKAYVEATLRK